MGTKLAGTGALSHSCLHFPARSPDQNVAGRTPCDTLAEHDHLARRASLSSAA
jgi:hypothetical protein